MTYAASLLKLEPVPPIGTNTVLLVCMCGRMECSRFKNLSYPVPQADAATAGMAFRVFRMSLVMPKYIAADRLGISTAELTEIERGLARCDWAAARAALQWRGRAAA